MIKGPGKTQEELREETFNNLRQKARLFQQVFGTAAGEQVLEALDEEFNGVEIKAPTDSDTNYNLGRRDVVMYIHQLLRFREE